MPDACTFRVAYDDDTTPAIVWEKLEETIEN